MAAGRARTGGLPDSGRGFRGIRMTSRLRPDTDAGTTGSGSVLAYKKGETVTPKVTVKSVKDDGTETELAENNDYTLSYYVDENCTQGIEAITEIGTYYVKVTLSRSLLKRGDHRQRVHGATPDHRRLFPG